MQNINFDDGFKEFTLNNDPNKVIRFNPADINLLERFQQAQKTIEKEQNRISADIDIGIDGENQVNDEYVVKAIDEVNQLIKDQIDYVFDSKVSDMVFGNQSPLNPVKGRPFFERFLDAVKPILETEILKEQKESQKRISKYTGQIK
jgi:hypothetical protein